MPVEYPKKLYAADGRRVRVESPEDEAQYDPNLWSASPAGPWAATAEAADTDEDDDGADEDDEDEDTTAPVSASRRRRRR